MLNPRRSALAILAVFLALPCATNWSAFTIPAAPKIKITIGKDTTFLTDPPLNTDGTVDYIKAVDLILSKDVTPENNAYIPLLKVFGPETIAPSIRDAVLTRLGQKPFPANGDYYQTFDAYLTANGKPDPDSKFYDQIKAVNGTAWKPADHPELAGWLTQENTHLDAIVAASKLDHLYFPMIPSADGTLISVLLPSLGVMRDASNALAIRASLHAGHGAIKSACADSLANHKLARLLSHRGTLIERLVGYAMENNSVIADRAILSSPQLTAAEAKSFLAGLQALPSVGDAADAVDFERLELLDFAMFVARGREGDLMKMFGILVEKPETPKPPPLTAQELQAVDWDAVLRQINGYFDNIIAASHNATFAKRQAAWQQCDKDVETLKANPAALLNGTPTKRVGNVIVAVLMPSLARADTLYERTAMLADMDTVAFALATYHAEKGSYPATLASLAPAYIAAIPNDRFNDKPLIYKPTATGFVLYSVADDMEDNNAQEKRDAQGKLDLVIRVGS